MAACAGPTAPPAAPVIGHRPDRAAPAVDAGTDGRAAGFHIELRDGRRIIVIDRAFDVDGDP